MELIPSILDYLGKYENGVLVSIGITYQDKFYESIFYYTEDKMIITIDEPLREIIGDIEFRPDYVEFMESLINMVEPYQSVINDLKEYNPNWESK